MTTYYKTKTSAKREQTRQRNKYGIVLFIKHCHIMGYYLSMDD